MVSLKALVNMTTKIAEIIKAHQSFEVITHKSPDEDAVGASRALGLALVTLGKSVCLVYPTPVPDILDFTDKPLEQDLLAIEITFLVDVSDMAMLANTKPRGKVVVIDHHRTTNNIGYASWIDSEKSSTCEMIYDLLFMDECDDHPFHRREPLYGYLRRYRGVHACKHDCEGISDCPRAGSCRRRRRTGLPIRSKRTRPLPTIISCVRL